jgi:hypothetical protein
MMSRNNTPLKGLGVSSSRAKLCWVVEQYSIAEQMGVYYRFVTHDLQQVVMFDGQKITLQPNQTENNFVSQLWQAVELPHMNDVFAFRLKGMNLFLTQNQKNLEASTRSTNKNLHQTWVIREGFC